MSQPLMERNLKQNRTLDERPSSSNLRNDNNNNKINITNNKDGSRYGGHTGPCSHSPECLNLKNSVEGVKG